VEHTNFTLRDLSHTALAFSLYPLFFLIPGFVAGWLTNVLDFRHRRSVTRMLLSLTFSISLMPILTYLVARWLSFSVVWGFYAITWAVLAGIGIRHVRQLRGSLLHSLLRISSPLQVSLAIALFWIVVATLSLIDLEIGNRLYFSVTTYDYTKNISVTDAITRTGVPPVNPSFHPGHGVQLFYYYFWFLLCSLMDRLGGTAIDARGAVFGSTLWVGLALMAMVALALRFLRQNGAQQIHTRAVAGIALLAISGLDIIPVVLETAMSFALGQDDFHSDPEWWNEQVTAWTGTMVWVPHHLASLITCLTGLMLLRTLDFNLPQRKQWPALVIAGLAFASAAGLSIWVTFVFAIFLGIWLIMLVVLPNWQADATAEARAILLAGTLAAVCASPYLIELQKANQLDVQLPIAFKVRRFLLLENLLEANGINHSLIRSMLDLVLLPVNYMLELGYFAFGAMLYWEEHRRLKLPLRRGELSLVVLCIVSLLMGAFFVSSIRNNDLGWRGLLFAQFVLLLWTVDFTLGLFRGRMAGIEITFVSSPPLKPHVWKVALLLFVAGALTSAYNLTMLRIFPVLNDLKVVTSPNHFAQDHQIGQRTYALREVYESLQKLLPPTAITQHNPDILLDRFHELYGHRQVVAADYDLGTLYGISEQSYMRVSTPIIEAFAADSPPATARALCKAYAINVLVVKDTDPLWNNPASWVWADLPLLANDYARVFDCAALLARP